MFEKKLPFTLAALLVAAIVCGTWLAGSGPVVAADDDEDETPLTKHMLEMEDHLKVLRRSLRKDDAENKAKSLESIQKLQLASLECKILIPKMAPKIPEAERAKWIEDYRKDMAICIGKMFEMEVLVIEGKNDEAYDMYKTLKELEDEGHEKFLEEDE